MALSGSYSLVLFYCIGIGRIEHGACTGCRLCVALTSSEGRRLPRFKQTLSVTRRFTLSPTWIRTFIVNKYIFSDVFIGIKWDVRGIFRFNIFKCRITFCVLKLFLQHWEILWEVMMDFVRFQVLKVYSRLPSFLVQRRPTFPQGHAAFREGIFTRRDSVQARSLPAGVLGLVLISGI